MKIQKKKGGVGWERRIEAFVKFSKKKNIFWGGGGGGGGGGGERERGRRVWGSGWASGFAGGGGGGASGWGVRVGVGLGVRVDVNGEVKFLLKFKKKIEGGGGSDQGGCEWRSEAFVKIQKKRGVSGGNGELKLL